MRATFLLPLATLTLALLAFPAVLPGKTAAILTTLHSFGPVDANNANLDGGQSQASLSQGSDGNFYGTTQVGGPNGVGTVFRITPDGLLTTLHSFSALDGNSANHEGADPYSRVIEGKNGNLYGVAYYGGASGTGTIFRITPAGELTVLHTFGTVSAKETNSGGAHPAPSLCQGNDGDFYGATFSGGANGTGTIFKITPAGALTTLHTFGVLDDTFANSDGANCETGLLQSSDGNFYGSAIYGGKNGEGTVFKITPAGDFTTLHSFGAVDGKQANADGAIPSATSLIEGSDGSFYSTTQSGGVHGMGTVFKITPAGEFTSLHSFGSVDHFGDNNDGAIPFSGVIQGSDGNFYGTTEGGGTSGKGTVFQMTPAGALTALHDFMDTDGAIPYGGVIQGRDGIFYGTTRFGLKDPGTVFRLGYIPVITSPSSALATVGRTFTYQITASYLPTSYAASGLPAGLAIDPSTGTISGTPTTAGDNLVSLQATNAVGSGTATLNLSVRAILSPPEITSAAGGRGQVGVHFSYQITATNSPTAYSAPGLPPDLSVDASTGIISGTPTAAGSYALTIGAANDAGTGTAILDLTFVLAPPVISSDAVATGEVGVAFSYQIMATNTPTAYGVLGLPAGLTVNASTGLISGTPEATGSYLLTLTATNSAGIGNEALALTIRAGVPIVTVTTAGDGMAVEGGEKGRVVVRRIGDTSAALTVLYKTKGTAKAGVDYKPTTGIVAIPAGSAQAKIKIKPIDNATHDGTRKVKVKLLPATDGSYVLGEPVIAKVRIIDND